MFKTNGGEGGGVISEWTYRTLWVNILSFWLKNIYWRTKGKEISRTDRMRTHELTIQITQNESHHQSRKQNEREKKIFLCIFYFNSACNTPTELCAKFYEKSHSETEYKMFYSLNNILFSLVDFINVQWITQRIDTSTVTIMISNLSNFFYISVLSCTQIWTKETVRWNTLSQERGPEPSSPLIRPLETSMPYAVWTGRKSLITHFEHRLWTSTPTGPWSPSLSSSSRFRISMTMNQSFWRALIQLASLRCRLWVRTF